MSNVDKNILALVRKVDARITKSNKQDEPRDPLAKYKHRTISNKDIQVGMILLEAVVTDNGIRVERTKVKTVSFPSPASRTCAIRGIHVNTTKCYDPAGYAKVAI